MGGALVGSGGHTGTRASAMFPQASLVSVTPCIGPRYHRLFSLCGFVVQQGLCDTERHLIALEKHVNRNNISQATPVAKASEGMLLRKLVEAGDDGAGKGRMVMPDDEVVTQAQR